MDVNGCVFFAARAEFTKVELVSHQTTKTGSAEHINSKRILSC
jgi:hypothetical protein